jgi:hypothetical protein
VRAEGHSWGVVAARAGITEAGARSRWARATKAAAAQAGLVWAGDQEQGWQRHYAAVVAHHARTGRWPTTSNRDPEVAVLGRWLAAQRRAHRGGRLPPALTAADVPLNAAQQKTGPGGAAPTPAELADQYREGASLQQLAVEHRLPVPQVRSLVVAGGGTIRGAARMPTERLLEIQAWGARPSRRLRPWSDCPRTRSGRGYVEHSLRSATARETLTATPLRLSPDER